MKTKESKGIIDFLNEIYNKAPFDKLLADNGKEFDNKVLKSWCKNRKIVLKFSVPYFHGSNGRVERMNRAIRETLKRTKGNFKLRLPDVTSNYNKMKHRAITMSPNEAVLEENSKKVLEAQNKYKKEFTGYNSKSEEFKEGDAVLLRN